jgi:transcriptional regulator of arginine metabolism
MHNNAFSRSQSRRRRRYRTLPVGAILSAVQSPAGKRKPERHEAILRLIGSHAIGSQEELRQLLHERGWQVTQATLSRDLRELGLVRAQTDDGARYVRPESLGADEDKPSLEMLLPQLFDSVDGVSELLVLHTLPSGAQPIAEGIDATGWPEIIGTIAGENTILIVCRSSQARVELAERLRTLAGQRGLVRG